ncbi:hypothetical protein [Roseovarius ramblicola]|uniref:Core-binding (CB) domain-containing protein n=1 Tax=Roseovarius ramblicola TaxID=2022336 RepID=A0ABV5HYM9_9RHOB
MSNPKSIILSERVSSKFFSPAKKRVVDRFLEWFAQSDATKIDRHLFLAYGHEVGTRAVLSDLEKALSTRSSDEQDFRAELRAAVLDHRRRMDGNPMVVDIISAPWWIPFVANCDLDRISILEIRRLDAWLRWMTDKGRTSPTAADFLEYGARFDSEVPLVSLQTTLAKLDLPNIPSLALDLPKAIAQKRAQCRGTRHSQSRTHWPRELSVAPEELPSDWRTTLKAFRSLDALSDNQAPSHKTVGSHERRLRELAWSCCTTGNPVELTAEAVARHARIMKQRGCRATSRDINISFLVRFAEYLTTATDTRAAPSESSARMSVAPHAPIGVSTQRAPVPAG